MEQDLTVYVRPECHLCEDMLRLLAGAGVRVTVVDITGEAGLEAWYGERVPVLVRGGRILAQAPFDLDEVLDALYRS